jgi:hypothetical protein
LLIAALAAAILLIVEPALAGTLSGGAGIDYQAGPESQSYRGALLFASADMTPGDLTVAAIRYQDSRLGPGTGGFASAGVGIASGLAIRAVGLRTFGDRGFDAWRLRGGPELRVASDATLGAYYLRLHDSSPENFGAAGIELSVPVSPSLSGQVGSSYGRWSGGATTAQATLAGTWRAGRALQFLCEVDLGKNVITTSTTAPSSGGLWSGLPVANNLGGGNPGAGTTTDSRVASVAQFGVRFLFP